MALIKVSDKITEFIPEKHNVNFVVLGTMGSSDARWINGRDPGSVFYYNNSRNNFWRIMGWLNHGRSIPIPQLPQRPMILEKNGIAMSNLVGEILIDEIHSKNPSDALLFDALNSDPKRLKVKIISPEFRNLLRTKPVFFTCLSKRGIISILEEFYVQNDLDLNLIKNIIYLPSPTRCSSEKRSRRWLDLGFKVERWEEIL